MRNAVVFLAKSLLVVVVLVLAGIGGAALGKPSSSSQVVMGLVLLGLALLLAVLPIRWMFDESRRRGALKAALLGTVGVCCLSALFMPVVLSAKVAARSSACHTNLKNLSTSIHIYIASSDDVFPPADRWATLIGHAEPPRCPLAKSPYSYAMNRHLSKVPATEIAEPSETVLIFEMDAQTPNASGTEADVVDRHGRRPQAVMTDGHVGTSRGKRWKP